MMEKKEKVIRVMIQLKMQEEVLMGLVRKMKMSL
jgi:hypothetical protein